jgi:hypothetical protein
MVSWKNLGGEAETKKEMGSCRMSSMAVQNNLGERGRDEKERWEVGRI